MRLGPHLSGPLISCAVNAPAQGGRAPVQKTVERKNFFLKKEAKTFVCFASIRWSWLEYYLPDSDMPGMKRPHAIVHSSNRRMTTVIPGPQSWLKCADGRMLGHRSRPEFAMSYLANRIQPVTLASSVAAPGILAGTRSWYPADCSIFGLTAQISHALAARAEDAIGLLLAAAALPPGGTAPASVWAAEAMHRAYATLQLFLRLHQCSPLIDRLTRDLECWLAADLARTLRALATANPRAPAACGPALRAVVHNLAALFAPATDDLRVETDIEPVTLPGAARRALVLLAHELVAEAILQDRPAGHISVILRPLSPGLACLTVTDDGATLNDEVRQPETVATDLAALMQADLHYARREAGHTTAVIFRAGHALVTPQRMQGIPAGPISR
jgi:hypothetical protein